jgi:hypothetical protein
VGPSEEGRVSAFRHRPPKYVLGGVGDFGAGFKRGVGQLQGVALRRHL